MGCICFFARTASFTTFLFAVSYPYSRMPTVPKKQRTRAQRKFYLHQSRPAQVKAREEARQDRRVVILDNEERETRPDETTIQSASVVVAQPEAKSQPQPTQHEPEIDNDSDAISIIASDSEI